MKKQTNLIILILVFLVISCVNKPKNPQEDPSDSTTQLDTNYISIHQSHEQTYAHHKFTKEEQWDSLQGIQAIPAISNKKTKVNNKIKTFGWHIYSNGSSHYSYNYDLLWGISYFSYGVNPNTGSYKSVHQWKTTTLIDSAKAHGCKVFLTISNFGAKDNATFLKNPQAQTNLIDSVKTLLALRKADGINLDFESVSAKNKSDFTSFINLISSELKKEKADYMISLCLYAVDFGHVFDIKAIDKAVDFYTLMGYDYYGGFSKNAGPVSPLRNSKAFGPYSLESSVDYYINAGTVASKIILGLPYYGAEWQVKDSLLVASAQKFISHPPYKNIEKYDVGLAHLSVHFDSISASSYCNKVEADGAIRQLWFDNRKSLSVKYDWIKEKKLGGVGFWALGYDHGYPELWELLADKFGEE